LFFHLPLFMRPPVHSVLPFFFWCARPKPPQFSALQTGLNTLGAGSEFSGVNSGKNGEKPEKPTWFFAKLTYFCPKKG